MYIARSWEELLALMINIEAGRKLYRVNAAGNLERYEAAQGVEPFPSTSLEGVQITLRLVEGLIFVSSRHPQLREELEARLSSMEESRGLEALPMGARRGYADHFAQLNHITEPRREVGIGSELRVIGDIDRFPRHRGDGRFVWWLCSFEEMMEGRAAPSDRLFSIIFDEMGMTKPELPSASLICELPSYQHLRGINLPAAALAPLPYCEGRGIDAAIIRLLGGKLPPPSNTAFRELSRVYTTASKLALRAAPPEWKPASTQLSDCALCGTPLYEDIYLICAGGGKEAFSICAFCGHTDARIAKGAAGESIRVVRSTHPRSLASLLEGRADASLLLQMRESLLITEQPLPGGVLLLFKGAAAGWTGTLRGLAALLYQREPRLLKVLEQLEARTLVLLLPS